MDILYTVEEKYLQAVEEFQYGELPKALHLFHEIIKSDPEYARAYHELGRFYQYNFKDFKTAGYYYKKCIELDPEFPDVYEHYLGLLIILDMQKSISQIANQALLVAGVYKSAIYEHLGNNAEQRQEFTEAVLHYKKASMFATNERAHSSLEEHLKRIELKQKSRQKMIYAFQG